MIQKAFPFVIVFHAIGITFNIISLLDTVFRFGKVPGAFGFAALLTYWLPILEKFENFDNLWGKLYQFK